MAKQSATKINVCHKGHIIDVSVNSLKGHINHGDAVDRDGDGFFDIENPCSEIDCDDNNPLMNPGMEEIIGDYMDNDCNSYTSYEEEEYEDEDDK